MSELIPVFFVCSYVSLKNKVECKKRWSRDRLTHICASADSLRCLLSDRCSSLAHLSYSVSMANLSCCSIYHLLQSYFSFTVHLHDQPEPFGSYFSSLTFLSSSVSMANLSHLVATIFYSLAFLSSSVHMANMSRLVAAPCSLALLSSSISKANLSCLLQSFESGQALFLKDFCF